MRKAVFIVLISILSVPIGAEVNREQFEYNWYVARRSLDERQYAKALVQFLFCEQINPQDGKTKDYLGMLFMSLKDTLLAQSYFQQAYRFDPKESWRNYASLLFNTGQDMFKAIEIVEEAAKNNPKDDKILSELLNMYVTVNQYDKALKTIDDIEKIHERDNNTLYDRCRILCYQRKEKKALELIKNQQDNVLDARLYKLKILILRSIKATWAELEAAYKAYLMMDANDWAMFNDYAYDLAILGHNLSAAEQIAASLLDKHPNEPLFLDTYALILHMEGQSKLALFYISKAYDIIQKNVSRFDQQTKDRVMMHYNLINK